MGCGMDFPRAHRIQHLGTDSERKAPIMLARGLLLNSLSALRNLRQTSTDSPFTVKD
ncbi:hypothetical protein SAY86_003685 [Trapa natans]|uniref:Uncharacterized protein n=1 Tax=Trapa natans TaxID=22666 RepID=A0AAN7RPI9_TRANT|nr:hypothetical protein SAY86_003685 [Trapa natans]